MLLPQTLKRSIRLQIGHIINNNELSNKEKEDELFYFFSDILGTDFFRTKN